MRKRNKLYIVGKMGFFGEWKKGEKYEKIYNKTSTARFNTGQKPRHFYKL